MGRAPSAADERKEIILAMTDSYQRDFNFEAIHNFRDLGGYRTKNNQVIAWKRIFRSGELRHMTPNDIKFLKNELKIKTVIDLRSNNGVKSLGVGQIDELNIKYCHIPAYGTVPSIGSPEYEKEKTLLDGFSYLGQIYASQIRKPEVAQNMIKILEILADKNNLSVILHCNAGQSRTGVAVGVILSALGITDEDVIRDYTLSDPYIQEFVDRWNRDPKTADVHKTVPQWQNVAVPESMVLLLTTLKKEYGSTRDYMKSNGVDSSLFTRLEKALLIRE